MVFGGGLALLPVLLWHHVWSGSGGGCVYVYWGKGAGSMGGVPGWGLGGGFEMVGVRGGGGSWGTSRGLCCGWAVEIRASIPGEEPQLLCVPPALSHVDNARRGSATPGLHGAQTENTRENVFSHGLSQENLPQRSQYYLVTGVR